ncbi:hypothetical protein STRCI_000055 [Streptomyces cinnabarinus]|uniref:Uncharacterized protein n=1 Tax=Streptomyces cinnabarinus TaxID=67287 RepID=A0ABY7K3I2_9ACTN|nr:hypothetical protein [Streptomyces cinnabarinus]WAZ19035.1 hypothetical protein STRCI_000055 [Streptomyces cinnabarinus]
MDMHPSPDQNGLPGDTTGAELREAWRTGRVFGPPIRRIFRDVVSDRLKGPHPPQAAMLFDPLADPFWKDDGRFLGDFYNAILHQDTCQQGTAGGVALLAVLAVDDRVPARRRFDAVDLLFCAATVTERKLAGCWPDTPPHADPDSEDRARRAVQSCTPDLLARWSAECPAVRLALAGLAVVFPTARTLPALTPRLQGFTEQHPPGTDIGDYVRFVLTLAAQDDNQTLACVEDFTDAYWKGTSRSAPTRARALHLLGQMLDTVGTNLTRSQPGE